MADMIFGMTPAEAEAKYGAQQPAASPSFLSKLTSYIPNVMTVPETYQGLLGDQESAALQRQANIQGLLGAAVALSEGMSRTGSRRSALQNILGAAASGYQAAGGAMEQGLKNYQTGLQLTSQVAKSNVLNKLRSGQQITENDLAVLDPEKYAQRKLYEQMVAEEQKRLGQVPATGVKVDEAQVLETEINRLMANAAVSARNGDAAAANNFYNAAEKLRERQGMIAAGGIDLTSRIETAPEQFKDQYRMLDRLRQTNTLKGKELSDAVRSIDTSVIEFQKGNKFEGATADYSQYMFGTTDRTKLTRNQLANVLAYQNAPTEKDRASIAIDAQRLKFETGQQGQVPKGRTEFLGGSVAAAPAPAPVAPAPVIPAPAAPTAVVPAPAQAPAKVPATAPAPAAAPAPAPAKQAATPVIDPKVYSNPLITRPDTEVPPKKKQELIQAQPGLVSATNYTLKNIVDARNAAKALLDNPNYINAISGMTAPAMAMIPGTDAYTANEVLNNILGRSFISEIQEMRANSPTGGAVGSVAVAEMNSLSKIRGALTLGMKEAELKKQLQSYIDNANRALKTIPNDYARTHGYSGEFDELLGSEVVSPKPTTQKLPPGVKVRRKE